MIRHFFSKRFYFLSILSVFALFSCNNDDENMTPETMEFEYMSVNLNGEQYKSLINATKQIGLANATYTLVETNGNNEVKYLWLQGEHADFNINIRIPENLWQTGTYPLVEGLAVDETACFVTFIAEDGYFDFEVEGELTITNFDLDDRIFEATFSFSSTQNMAEGTLDYPLDNEEFD